jgi:hypothetical protein
MAFYGSLFQATDQQGDQPRELNAEQSEFADRLAMEWLKRAASRATKAKVREIGELELSYISKQMGAEQGLGAVMRSAIAGLGKISWFAPYGMGFAERFVNRSLTQVTLYLTSKKIRSAALESVLNLIGEETKVLIGHSLGSVIAYEAAHLMNQPLALLMTLGVPRSVSARSFTNGSGHSRRPSH